MGARKLKKEKRTDLLANSVVVEPENSTKKPLRAVRPNDVDLIVHLKGENLHGNYNCDYWPETSCPLAAKTPSNSSFPTVNVTVKLFGQGIHEHDLSNRPSDGVGIFGMNSLSDYEPAPGVPFDIGFPIDLGVYAPLSTTGEYCLSKLTFPLVCKTNALICCTF